MFEVRIPSLGESVTEAQIARWAKADGDTVKQDEVLLELESDKASMELPAERSGVLRIMKQAGETVAVGDLVARIEDGPGATAAPPRPQPEAPAPTTGHVPSPPPPPAPTPARAPEAPPPSSPPQAASRAVGPLSPAVRNLIEEHGLDPSTIVASGRGGRLTKGDVLLHLERRAAAQAAPAAAPAVPAAPPAPASAPAVAAVSQPAVPAAPAPRPAARPAGSDEERVAMSRIRKRIAERLVAAQHTAAILTTFNEIDCSGIMALRAQYKDRFQQKHGIGLGFMSFFARACIVALEEIPAVNAQIDGDDVVYRHYVHLGVAVGTERGLVVPVVRHAERMSFADLEREIARLAGLARDGKLGVDDLAGGTFTISNGGVYGSLLSTPILNPPQSGILGMHKIEKRPIVVHDDIVVRPMMYVALSYDHRLVDGEQAVTFLVRVKERLEDPARLLLDV
jgi:2-oxoglutarate dehydrogenase E2 component (dihydrolipoamide succinyltransferase)